MKAPLVALLLLADQRAGTAYLCERAGQVMTYRMIGHDRACEIQLYPPNQLPKTIWRGGGCLGLVLDMLGSNEDEGWRCDLPTLAILLKPEIRDARLQWVG